MANKDKIEEGADEVKAQPKKKVSKITFTLVSPNPLERTRTRVFEEATHGEDFETIALQFEEANTLETPKLSASEVGYKEHADEIKTRNATKKNHIIGKVVE